MSDWDHIITNFVTLWVTIDPIGTVPVFLAVSAHLKTGRTRIAVKAVVISAVILLLFIVGGELLLDAMEIPLPAFQIAGGIVLFLFALTMIFGDSKPEQEEKIGCDKDQDIAVFPLAVPSLASPGAMMAVVLLTDNHRNSVAEQAMTALMMLLVLAVSLGLLLAAQWILWIIGKSGANIVSRVMGMILASVAASNVLEAIQVFFGLAG